MNEENDILLDIAGEGGGIKIQRRNLNGKTVFSSITDEYLFSKNSTEEETNQFDDFHTLLETIFIHYPIRCLYITNVHCDYKTIVAKEFERMLNTKKIKADDFFSMENNSEKLSVNFNYDIKMKKWKATKTYKFIGEDLKIERNEFSILFDKIRQSKLPEDLKKIACEYNLNLQNDKYPRLKFGIKPIEIEELINNKTLTFDEKDKLTINQENLNPLTRLLFALVWKQGDLQKLRQIIKGIKNAGLPETEENDSLVFYSFGNHLGNPEKNPIIDQHVVRAVKLYLSDDESEYYTIRKSDKVNQFDKQDYLKFISELKCQTREYLFYIDKILFEIGKIVKLSKKLG